MSADVSHDPRTGLVAATVRHSTRAEVDAQVAAAVAAAPVLAATPPMRRRAWIGAVAAALREHRDELVGLADRETALGEPRLGGEVERTAGQLEFYADVAVEGSFLAATLDSAEPALAKVNVPVGPVAVFGASNFPFAFSALGNDTASALAAGNPVVVKGHPAHPGLTARVVEIARVAWAAAGGPAGALGLVVGFEAGTALVQHPDIAAVAFTGSQAGGLALWRLANEREVVIPVYAEMGTVNPVVVTPVAGADMGAIAAGFVGSFTLGSGQFCTKPGLLLAPAGAGAAQVVGDALVAARPAPVMLTEGIAASVRDGVAALVEAGASVVASVPADGTGWSAPATVLTARAADLTPGSRMLDEVFGAVALVVEYDSVTEALGIVARLQGALSGSVFAAEEDPDARALVDGVAAKVGRVVLNGWPTGVAFTWAQHHGGPWPATSNPVATSVGAGALARFVRPVAYQGMADDLLPEALRTPNPWGITRWVDGVVRPGVR